MFLNDGSTSKATFITKNFKRCIHGLFKVLETQFQMFIKSKIYLNDEYIVMTRNYFLEYTRLDIPEFLDTLIQNIEYVLKSRLRKEHMHKWEYEHRLNQRLMQRSEEKDDSSKAMDARQQHTEQPEFNNEGKVDQNAEQCHDIRPLPAKLTDNMTTKLSDQLLESENVCLKKTVAQFQKDFGKLEAHCINLELQLQMENNVLKSGQQREDRLHKEKEAHETDIQRICNILSKGHEYIVQSYRGRTQSFVAEKTDISENRASRNFDLMINKWCLLKITLQAPFLNVQMTFEQRSSTLVLHQMTFVHISSSLGLHGNDV
ncbi:hypothetical protein Tco_0404858 [Tanacetum coccineum]